MLNKAFIISLIMLIISNISFAQSGSLKGKIIDKSTGEPIPFANVIAERGGNMAGGGTSDFDGYYTIKPLLPGKYDVKVTYIGYNSVLMSGVIVSPDKITFLDLKMKSSVEQLDVVEIIEYVVPLISKDNTQSGETITREDIARMPSRGAASVAATVVTDASGNLHLRGSRTEASNTYIDGVKVRGSSKVPQAAIEQVSVVTGGVPAKYGDATGGIISITTRGPSKEYYGGGEILTSQFLDPYKYNLFALEL